MKLRFLGTRGYIEARTRRHRRHSSLMAAFGGRKVMIDCGEDWLGRMGGLDPDAIVVTHGHPDHAWGLKKGASCPVYATGETWKILQDFDIDNRRVLDLRAPTDIGGILFEAFAVSHSTRAPAVGYRVTAGGACIFYVPDVVDIGEREEALGGIDVYIGDGAAVERSLVRGSRDNGLIGHVSLKTQLDWCAGEGVPLAVFTHCGSRIVRGDERRLGAAIRRMARQRGLEARIAHDGMEMTIPSTGGRRDA